MEPHSETADSVTICWTTVATREDAERLAKLAVERKLAACAQIDAPITSVYQWQGRIEQEQEFRLWLKTPSPLVDQLESLVLENHPYDTPQWVGIKAGKVSEMYLKWAYEVSNLRGFV